MILTAMKTLPRLILFIAGLSCPALASTEYRLPEVLTRAAANLPAGGLVLTAIDGEAASHTAFRPVHADPNLPPEQTLFEIGSITKVFTGLLLAQAVLEDRLQLDNPIGPLLPNELDLAPAVAAITLRQLATHTSGLPRLPTNMAPAKFTDPYADYGLDQLHTFLRDRRLTDAGPHPAAYSNLGAGLLGYLLERVYGQSYADLVAEIITGPLGLSDTVITLSDDQARRFATPHSGRVEVSPWTFAALPGAGALRSTSADLTRFAQALLDPTSPLAAAWALAREPQAPFGGQGHIGLGVLIATRDGHRFYQHGGGTGGFRGVFELEPATGRATVLWLNNDTLEPANLLAAARRPALPAAVVQEESPARSPLTDYTGTFALDEKARFTVAVHPRGNLVIRLTGQGFLPVVSLGEDRFTHRGVGAEFHFARATDGTVNTLTLHQGGQILPAKRITSDRPVLFPDAEELTAYAGTYQLAPGVLFEVNARDEQLVVKLTGQPAFPVYPSATDQFYYDVVDAALTFERDTTGRVVALTLHQNNQNPRAPRVEE